MQTLLLDTVAWDLCVDAANNIAVASDPYSKAQDVASACRTWLREYWFDTSAGVDYLNIFGIVPVPLAFTKVELDAAALTVPDVSDVQIFLATLDPHTRNLSGQVQLIEGGTVAAAVNFSV